MSKIDLKSAEEISLMAEGGQKLSSILMDVFEKIEPGLSTLQIDSWIDKGIVKQGGEPSFKKVRNYRYASCVGLNGEIVHSIPKEDKIIKEGDILKIDLGMFYKGFNTDMSWSWEILTKKKKDFLGVGENALYLAIDVARSGNRVGHISLAIEKTITQAGYCPVNVLTGHGIGRKLHEEPMVPGVLKDELENTPKLLPGMTFAIEVIYAQKSPEAVLGADGWTISTKDGKISGLFEQTIAITENDPLIITPFKPKRGCF